MAKWGVVTLLLLTFIQMSRITINEYTLKVINELQQATEGIAWVIDEYPMVATSIIRKHSSARSSASDLLTQLWLHYVSEQDQSEYKSYHRNKQVISKNLI